MHDDDDDDDVVDDDDDGCGPIVTGLGRDR